MQFGLLGPLLVLDDDGEPVDLGGRQPRTVLAVLLASASRPVSVDALVDAVWGEHPPATATGTLQSYVSRMRRRLGRGVVVWDEAGYRLDVTPEQVDHLRFERLADEGRTLLDRGELERAREVLVEAESLWRGPALAEFGDLDVAAGLVTRLEQRRLDTIQNRIDADLALGRHATVVGEASELVAAEPLRERFREQLALALYRSGRQAEALRCLADASRTLRDIGIEPGRGLRDLEAGILNHDPELDLVAAAGRIAAPGAPASTPATPSSASALPPLVERDAEMAVLTGALDECRTDSRFVVIEGDPGIGKTRLAEELRVRASERGALVVWGRSDEGGAAPSLWPWLAPMRAIAEQAGTVPTALGELLAGESPVAAGQAQAIRFERFEAVAALMEQVAAKQPVVVLLDDLQWADATSLELLAVLAGRLGAGVLIVGTMRHLEVGRNDAVTDALAAIARRPGSRRLQLQGLSAAAAGEILASAGQSDVTPELVETIHDRAEGNPFYMLELGRLLSDQGTVGREVPATVGDVIRRRLTRLSPDARDMLAVAAVVGRDVEINLLARAAGEEPLAVLDVLEPAVVHRVLAEVEDRPGVLRFTHALVREVVLEDLTSVRRARLHLAVADAIEAAGAGVDEAEILAEHLWRAAPVGVGRRAAEALERASEVALRRVSYAAAEELLTKAVQLRRATTVSDEDAEAELEAIYRLLEVARALRYFQGATSLDVLDRAKELAARCGRQEWLREILWFEWSASATASRLDDAAPLAKSYMELTLNDPDAYVQAQGYQVRGVLAWMNGRISEAFESFQLAAELQGEAPPGEEGFAAEQWMLVHTFLLFNSVARGAIPLEEAWAGFDAMLEMVAEDHFAIASVCGFAATTAVAAGDWEQVARYGAIGLEADPGSEFAFWGGQGLMQSGIAAAWRGDLDEGTRLFDEGRKKYIEVGARSGMPSFETAIAVHLLTHGRVDEAAAHLAEARRFLDELGERWNESVVLVGEAMLSHARHDDADAVAKLEQAVIVASEQGAGHFLVRARETARQLGVELSV